MSMFGFEQKQAEPSIMSRGSTTTPNTVSSVFQSVWDSFQPKRYDPAGAGAGRGVINPDSTGFDQTFQKLLQQESRGKHRDESGQLTKSPVGALGITQIMPETGKKPGYGIAPLKDESEAEYLRVGRQLLQAYTKSFDGDIRKGLASYNHGPGNIQKLIKKYGDEWETKLPKETKNYLKKIVG